MPGQTRKRAAPAKRAAEAVPVDDARPISDEEQEAEIAALRAKNEENSYTARLYLDLMICVCIFVSGRQAWRYISTGRDTALVAVTILQTLLLPLSLSPSRLPLPRSAALHPIVTAAQVGLFMFEFVFLRNGEEGLSTELLRWALPELGAGAVEVQRRAEVSSDIALAKLERLKYPLKGA